MAPLTLSAASGERKTRENERGYLAGIIQYVQGAARRRSQPIPVPVPCPRWPARSVTERCCPIAAGTEKGM